MDYEVQSGQLHETVQNSASHLDAAKRAVAQSDVEYLGRAMRVRLMPNHRWLYFDTESIVSDADNDA